MNIINFLRSPDENIDRSLHIKDIVSTVLIYFGFTLVLGISFALINLHYNSTPVEYTGTLLERMAQYGTLAVVATIMLAATIEELIFRLPLKRNKNTIYISFLTVSFLVCSKILAGGTFSLDYIGLRIILSAMSALLLYLALSKLILKLNYCFYFYLMNIVFGVGHLSNYSLKMEEWSLITISLLFLYTCSIATGGIIYGYARMRHGFVFVCILHILNNLLPRLFF